MINKEKKIGIFGAGGFGREVYCCLLDYLKFNHLETLRNNIFFIVNDADYEKYKTFNYRILGVPVIPLYNFDSKEFTLIIAVGDPIIRKKIANNLPQDTEFFTLIHPNAVISEWVNLGIGTIVTAGCILTCDIKVGMHAHFNLCTTVGHDCIIGDFFTTAPGVNISGLCNIGNMVYLGTNACIKQGLKITDNVTIGMGAVVVKDITEPGIYVGNPASLLKK